MKKIMLATAAAAALVTGAATFQPAEAQVRYGTRYHHYHHGYHGGWGYNPIGWGAGAVIGTAAALATAPLWAASGPYYGYDYGYYPAYGYGYGYADPIYAPAPVVYRTGVAPRRVVYRTRYVAPRRTVTRTVVRADRPVRAERVRPIRY